MLQSAISDAVAYRQSFRGMEKKVLDGQTKRRPN